jgi:hypothetical protein
MIFEAFVAEGAPHRVRRAQTPGLEIGDFQPPRRISRQRSRQLGEPLSQ